MKRSNLIAMLVMTGCALACAPAPVEKNPYDDVITDLSALIEAETQRLDIPSLSIALVDDQRIVWQRGFGLQNAAEGGPASENTVYRVGSISKVVTATAMAQAAEQGLVDLDAPITDYIPELVFKDPFHSDQQITLRHLHAHRAGILRESPVGNYFDTSFPSIEETVRSIIGTELVRPVGSTTKYSNLGPTIAGLVLERKTGVPFAEYMEKHILDPIGMTSSSFLRDRDVVRRNLADAFMVGFDGSYFPAPDFELGTLPAGNLYSTVGDMSRFLMMFFAGGSAGGTRILSPEMVRDMMTLQFPDAGGGRGFGIGFGIGELDGHKLVSHGGAIYGFASLFAALPEEKLAVVVLNDVDLANGFDDKIAAQALRLMLNATTGATLELLPEATDPPASEIDAAAGKYLWEGRPAFVSADQGALHIQLDGSTTVYRRLADGSFIADGREIYGTSIVFSRGPEGEIDGFSTGGRQYTRVAGYEPDRRVPERWRSFVGDYGWPHDVMRIYALDGDLWTRVEWGFEYPLTEVSDGVFGYPDYGLYSNEQIRFTRDAAGKVTGADMASVPFPRMTD